MIVIKSTIKAYKYNIIKEYSNTFIFIVYCRRVMKPEKNLHLWFVIE
jgi:hypothetical protein